jgi:predicted alpha/beta-hydrolase family hydrolase
MSESEAYIGRCHCGSVVAAYVIEYEGAGAEEHKRAMSREVASWIRSGLAVERVTCQYVRENLRFCKCSDRPNRKKPTAQQLEAIP